MSGSNPRNEDLITGEPGSHPVGTGVGAAGGAVIGATVGTAIGGPIGTIIGAAIGVIAGGLAGKAIAEELDPTERGAARVSAGKTVASAVNPTAEDSYWSSGMSWDQARNSTRNAWSRLTD